MTATTDEAPPQGRQIFGHPRGLYTLFFTEMWERFTYYGMRALLVLFLVDAVATGGFGLDDKTATAIYGLYTAAVYLVALPGGWIADRLLGAQQAVWWGGILIMVGNALLGIAPTPAAFYCGLVVIILGVGLLKPNVSAIVASLYPEGGGRRDAGFTVFYMGINLGAFIGPLITATLAQKYGWGAGFFSAAVGMSIGLVQFRRSRQYLLGAGGEPHYRDGEDEAVIRRRGWMWVAIALGALAAVVALGILGILPFDPVALARGTTFLIVAMAAGFFAYLLLFAGLERVERDRILVLLVLFVACALFWAGFEQAGSSLNLFAERYTDRVIDSFNFEIPAGWFQSLNPIFILLFAPVFTAIWVGLARRNLDPSAPAKFAVGLILMGTGFLLMVEASHLVVAGAKVLPYWLIFTYMLHTFGELCLSPVGLSSVTKLAPQRFVGQAMGIWFLATSLGNLVAGLIAGEFDAENVAAMPGQYFKIVLFAVISGVVLLLIARPVQKLAHGVR
jgi:proton-dependent oligopeptide transporter, POT family